MASGSSAGRANSKGGFDFASDDILCSSYDDYDNHHESSNGTHSDPVIGTNSGKDFQKSRLSRSPVFPAYAQPEDSLDQELITTVERTMKKYTDNLMRFLEGVSSRLSQLELYCYNLDKSIGEMRSELASDNREADAKLKSLDKHLQEVHRSVQILRDKQELAETQKELAKLQLAHKDSSGSQQEEKSVTPTSESRKSDDAPESNNQQLALALPHQIVPQPAPQTTSQAVTQQPPYYLPAPQMPNAPAPSQIPQGPYAPADPQYRSQQMAPNPLQGQVNLPPQPQPQPQQQQFPQGQVNLPPQPQPQPQQQQFPQYQQQWSQQVPPSTVYPAYIQNQTTNPPPQEPQAPYGYGGSSRPIQAQVPPQAAKGGDGYPAPGSHPPVPSSGSYMMYDREGGRAHHPPPTHFSQAGGYPHPHPHPQPAASGGLMIRAPGPPQFVRNHPYNELIEKLVSMGYRGDRVTSVIQRLEESGQPVDFNAVLDRLNGHGPGPGSSQRAW